MSHYLVWARPISSLSDLRQRIASGDLHCHDTELEESLLKARFDPDGWVAWEEGTHPCDCAPKQHDLLKHYFTDFTAETVNQGDGWISIDPLPALWNSLS